MMNETGNSTEIEEFTYPLVVQIIQTILFTVVCIVGLVGNTLVIYVVVRFSKMQTVTNMYIVNLAIADECFLIGIPFLIATILNRHWIFGYFACKAYMLSTGINQFTSSILLCVMSADRYIAVCHPISSPKWRTPFISKIVSLFAWSFSILLMIPIIQHSKEIKYGGKSSCVVDWNTFDANFNFSNSSSEEFDNSESAQIFTWYTFVAAFAIPLTLIVYFYSLVILKLKNVGPKNKSREKKRSHRKVTNLVLTVITVYILCWLPYWVTQLAITVDEDNTSSITFHLLASCMSYSNSAINPILYAFLSDNFKKSFVKACTCAANKDVNATLQLENSVFPKKARHVSERLKLSRTGGTSLLNYADESDAGYLAPEPSTSAMNNSGKNKKPCAGVDETKHCVITNDESNTTAQRTAI